MRQASATLILGAILTATQAPAAPLEPVAAMVDALRTHAIVAVTAGHGEARGYAFAQLLIHDPRIIAAINDIVIEEGSSRYRRSRTASCGARACRSSLFVTSGATRRSLVLATIASGKTSSRPF